jgi:hypothetical protein
MMPRTVTFRLTISPAEGVVMAMPQRFLLLPLARFASISN